MSYILDALRKSETERRQGKVPDLGHQVQLIHRSGRKKGIAAGVWIALALLVNAGVLAVVFWPREVSTPADAQPPQASVTHSAPRESVDAPSPSAAVVEEKVDPPAPVTAEPVESEPTTVTEAEKPTIIVPSVSREKTQEALSESPNSDRVPHLIELPLSFQKSVPDLTFNSHIYASDPQARRVMINGQYLKPGDSFDGITVDRITEDGVVLRKQGQPFRVGVLRDWVSPR
ncbi:hypothetical protein MSNKSG1_06653 [Marinobacter santoriniensis NKSG1]|jgi:general secretion pathway protein B|uniref:Type II secretion system protein GspB C-terminal domain-containing protein n=1 Tax=Marinobacter santoriniensis NKSG1 TaxID=1288826 RepID=M7CTM9_9GAMM|nr:general secretion pathway protein GspB [Marinobacter santoriniensis]EMP55530.1 hypothetical protein MSNKSG1_06653 [Marinobacter santoriniensis NKSG1]